MSPFGRGVWLLPWFACAHGHAPPQEPGDLPDNPRDDWRVASAARTAATPDRGTATPDRATESASPPLPDRWRGRVVVAGHPAARFTFSIPAGLAPLRGVTPPVDTHERIELASQGPDGVGIADGEHTALNSIVVFSDPDGVGADFLHLSPADRQQIAARYVDGMREKFPDARQPQIVRVGSHLALRVELPSVVMPNRPVRRGRHYLVFYHQATASVDCLWTVAHAALMAPACEAVAAALERLPRR